MISSVLFSVKSFHRYVYGKEIQVQSDHKPLEIIMKKNTKVKKNASTVTEIWYRLYHSPGIYIPVADVLSRQSLTDNFPKYTDGHDAHVHSVMCHLPESDQKMKLISQTTKTDKQFHLLKSAVLDGWQATRKQFPPKLY